MLRRRVIKDAELLSIHHFGGCSPGERSHSLI
jgi:hypothetical protein